MSRLRLAYLLGALLLGLTFAACGSSGGGNPGDGGDGPTDPPPPGTNLPPGISLSAPTRAQALIAGDLLHVVIKAIDDGAATVRILLDGDHDPDTTGDQVLLYSGIDANGTLVERDLPTAGVGAGEYALIGTIDDGVHPRAVATGPSVFVHPGLATVAPPTRAARYAVSDAGIVFSVGEIENGGLVMNGDGVSDDGVMVVLRFPELTILPSSMSNDAQSPGNTAIAQVLGSEFPAVAWHRREQDAGADLNGDGDTVDTVVSYAVPAEDRTGFHTRGGAQLTSVQDVEARVVRYDETQDGTDLNGDADALDQAFGVLRFDDNSLLGLTMEAVPGAPLRGAFGSTLGAHLVQEAAMGRGNGGFDLNGDGDFLDSFLGLIDAGGRGATVGLAGQSPTALPVPIPPRDVDPGAAFAVSSEGYVGYYIDEAKASPTVPLNADLDTTDFIPALYDLATQVETLPGGLMSLNAGASARFLFYESNIMVFTVMEETTDWNGDLDTSDLEVLFWSDHARTPGVAAPVPAPAGLAPARGTLVMDGGNAASLAAGWVGINVGEFANGTDMNGDGDRLDTVYMLLEMAASGPVVHNTGLVTLGPGGLPGSSLPATGVAGSRGVVFQIAESVNGDRNQDGDINDTLLYFFDFLNPGVGPIQLENTGGFHAAVGEQSIAVTANETLTKTDHNGDGDIFDVVLRVFGVAGNLLEPSRPCAVESVPATRNGQVWAYLRSEATEGRDLNDDADQGDLVLGIWLAE